jgi:hypothetical protein
MHTKLNISRIALWNETSEFIKERNGYAKSITDDETV